MFANKIRGKLMKKSTMLMIALCLIGGLFIVIKISQYPVKKMLSENQDLINRVLDVCEGDDDIDTFANYAFLIMEDHSKWFNRYKDILKKRPELADKINERWMEVIYTLGSNLDNEENKLRKEKKAAAILLIAKDIDKKNVINFFKNKPNVNQEALTNYIKKYS